jgi:hypothetical protein
MEPIADSYGSLLVFRVDRYDGGLWLGADYGRPGDHWDAGCRFVFVRRK